MRPDLSELASGFLRDLTNGRYTDLELDEDYVATLLDDGDPKAVISGGEEDVANLALRLAISQMIAERAGQPLSLLILDEIFGSLDEDRRAAVVDLLREPGRPVPAGHPHHPRRFGARGLRSRHAGRASIWRAAWPRCGTSRSEGTMWRPDRSLRGPERPTLRDIEPLNRVFADAFTDRYSRDGLVGVRVPHLNTLVWRYALEDAGDGAMVWRDADGQMVAFNMVHHSGTEGLDGAARGAPRPPGRGARLHDGAARASTGCKAQGATTIGLETMPRTVENIGFYSRLGLVPGPLTVTLVHDVPRRVGGAARAALRRRAPAGASGSRSAGG